jgi:hypothetical protein
MPKNLKLALLATIILCIYVLYTSIELATKLSPRASGGGSMRAVFLRLKVTAKYKYRKKFRACKGQTLPIEVKLPTLDHKQGILFLFLKPNMHRYAAEQQCSACCVKNVAHCFCVLHFFVFVVKCFTLCLAVQGFVFEYVLAFLIISV